MSKKFQGRSFSAEKSLLPGFLLIVSLIAPIAAVGQPGGGASNSDNKPSNRIARTSAPKTQVSAESLERDFSEALTVVEDNYVNGKNLDNNKIFKSAIEEMLHALDPHSIYFDNKEFDQFQTEQRSEYFGIGATISDLREGDATWTYIRATFDGAPAHRAGLRYGDKILEVNGVSMKNKLSAEVSKNLRGSLGTTARVIVEQRATGERKIVEIVRNAVPQPSISEVYMIRPGVGYMNMSGGFNRTTADEFRAGMQQLKAQEMEKLIVDLRSNGGGLVREAYQIASLFLAAGQVVFSQRGRIPGSEGKFVSDNKNPDDTPLVLLVNRGTASASEIVAGAMQDHDRALIVGEPTFGKGLVMNPFLLPYNSAVLLTVAEYQTPSGRKIQRDYSSGSLYDYHSNGGSLRDERNPPQPTGKIARTDTGRIVYGGGGITPDEIVKPAALNQLQQKLQAPIFSFALELTGGKIAGLENFRQTALIDFKSDVKATDFIINDAVLAAFKKFIRAKQDYKQLTAAQLDREREHIARQLRFELAMAKYGRDTAYQVYNDSDSQIKRAVEVFPKAERLAQSAAILRKSHKQSMNE
ncbi:MAG TPA: S41 family peptidase [Pyrinomonadaceae bacterium]